MNPVLDNAKAAESNSMNTVSQQDKSCCSVWGRVCDYLPVRITSVGCVLNTAGALSAYFLSNWFVLGAAAANALKDGVNIYFLKDRMLREDADSAVRSVARESQAVSQVATDIAIKVDKFESSREESRKYGLEDHEKLAKENYALNQSQMKIDALTTRLEEITNENKQMQDAVLRLQDVFHKVAAATDGKCMKLDKSIQAFPVMIDHFAVEVMKLHEENLKLKESQVIDKQQNEELNVRLGPIQELTMDIGKEEAQVKELGQSEKNFSLVLKQIQEERRLLEIDKQEMLKLNSVNEKQILELKQLLS